MNAEIGHRILEANPNLSVDVHKPTHEVSVEVRDKAYVYAGEIIECGTLKQVYKNVSHPYTQGLFDSLPDITHHGERTRLKPIQGLMPDPVELPEGCKFADRCPYAEERCRQKAVPLQDLGEGHLIRCLKPLK